MLLPKNLFQSFFGNVLFVFFCETPRAEARERDSEISVYSLATDNGHSQICNVATPTCLQILSSEW